jgi:hypothetical protein
MVQSYRDLATRVGGTDSINCRTSIMLVLRTRAVSSS